MIISFDNSMDQYVRKIKNKEILQHCLGPRNTSKINKLNRKQNKNRNCVTYSKSTVMPNLISDESHREQLILIVRILNIDKINVKIVVDKYF